MRHRLHQLFEDERCNLSSARVGLWITVLIALTTIIVDIVLTVSHVKGSIPNTVYALEGTMFTAFAAWAAGPRIAQYIGPQIGAVASGLAAAARDGRLPSKHDDERGDDQ